MRFDFDALYCNFRYLFLQVQAGDDNIHIYNISLSIYIEQEDTNKSVPLKHD